MQRNVLARFRSSVIFPMSYSDSDTECDEIWKNYIGVGESGVSHGDIKTSHVGPCLCLLLKFKVDNKSTCYLRHYESEIEDSYVPSPELLENYLRTICNDLKDCLGIKSLAPVSANKSGISDIRLVVCCGDVDGRRLAKDALSLLNQKKVMLKTTSDADFL